MLKYGPSIGPEILEAGGTLKVFTQTGQSNERKADKDNGKKTLIHAKTPCLCPEYFTWDSQKLK